jgi:hypothetical protein
VAVEEQVNPPTTMPGVVVEAVLIQKASFQSSPGITTIMSLELLAQTAEVMAATPTGLIQAPF